MWSSKMYVAYKDWSRQPLVDMRRPTMSMIFIRIGVSVKEENKMRKEMVEVEEEGEGR